MSGEGMSGDGMTAVPAPPPLQPAPPRTSEASILLMGTVIFLAIVAGLLVMYGLALFPSNAPIEFVYAFGIIVDLGVVALVLGISAAVHRSRLRAAPRPPGAGARAIAGATLALVALLGWAASGGLDYFVTLFSGGVARYMLGAGGVFFLGVPWVLGLIFGALSCRRGGGTVNTVLSIGSIVCGLILAVVVVVASVLYGFDYTQ